MKLKYFIKLTSPNINAERRKIFYSSVKDVLGEKIKIIKSTNELGQKTSTYMFHKKIDGVDSYIIPLNQSPTEEEIDIIVSKLMNVLYVGDITVESSLILDTDVFDNHLSDDEFQTLAEQFSKKIHEDWLNERTTNGWRYGEKRDENEQTHPLIKPWNQLTDVEKDINPSLLKEFVEILKNSGFSISKKS